MSFDPGRHDPDLEFLGDRDLLELASLLRSRRLPDPPLDPAFRSSLRRDLRRRQYELLERPSPWWRRRLTPGPTLAWSAAAVGALLIGVGLLAGLQPPGSNETLIVQSPLDHMRNVALVQPMELTFQQSMDHQSVEQALQIEPATQVTYSWRGNTLLVQPVAGQLAPNTQYRLTLKSSAATEDHHPLGKPATFVFVTAAPSPSPAPPTPSPTSTGLALGTPTPLAAAGTDAAPAWSPDSGTVYFEAADTSLAGVPAAGGNPTSFAVTGVRAIAVAPDGSRVAALTDRAIYVAQPDGTGAQQYAAPGALAVGWNGQRLLAALPAGVVEVKDGLARAKPIAAFTIPAQAAAFAPGGDRLLYADTIGRTHLVDVAARHDTAWDTTTAGLPAWSQDGGRVAFPTSSGLDLAAPDGSGVTPVATLSQLGLQSPDGLALGWSAGAVLAASPAGLAGVDGSLRQPVQLLSGSFAAVDGAPDHTSVAYLQGGQLFTAPVTRPGLQPQLLSGAASVVADFMAARKAGDAAAARKDLDPAAQAASGTTLVFTGEPQLRRWFTVFAQVQPDGSVEEVQRLVLDDGKGVEVAQLDEILTLVSGADGRVLIHSLQQTPVRNVDSGPELISVGLDGSRLQLTFDSDLDPQSIGAIALAAQVGGAVPGSPTYANRTVTFDLSALPAGEVLQLTVPTGVKDVGGRGLMQALTITVTVPDGGAAAPTPTPSP